MRLTAAAIALAALAALPAAAEGQIVGYNASHSSGLHERAVHTYGATVADFTGNGWDDVLLVRHHDSFPALYANQGGRFTEITDQAFPSNPRRRDYHDCPAADVTGNGLLDFYCTLGASAGAGRKANELWLQRPGGTFVEAAAAYGVTDPFGRGRQATFIDANANGRPDLFVGNTYPRRDSRPSPNRLFINQGGSGFRPAPGYRLNRHLGADFTVQAIDFDRDGFEDLLICGKDGVRVFRNLRGRRFRNVTRKRNIRPGRCRSAWLTRVDNSRRPGLVVLRPNRVVVQAQRRGGKFERPPRFSRRIPRAHRVGVGDINRSGRADIYVLRSGRPASRLGAIPRADAPDRMLVNRRAGRRFQQIWIPTTRRGVGQSVATIDHDRNGLDGFIVMNGRNKARGPVRLIGFRRR